MKVAVVGSRNFSNYELLKDTLSQYNITTIVSGGAIGADRLAERYARENNIDTKIYYPDWKLGKGAGLMRNTQIIQDSDMVIAFWDGTSRGTHDSIKKAKAHNKECKIVYF